VLQINYNNDLAQLHGEIDEDVLKMIIDECSYKPPQFLYSEKYQKGAWDGKISLFRKFNKTFPAGLLPDITDLLNLLKVDYKINDLRPEPEFKKKCIVDLGKHSFRDYQQATIQKARTKERGIFHICTGGGKTKTTCGIISDLSVYPVIFIVPSVSLLKQTVKEFEKSLKPLDEDFSIGEIGGGVCKISHQGVNVCTYQTLLQSYDKKYSEDKKKIIDDKDKNSIQNLEKVLKSLNLDLKLAKSEKIKTINKKIKETEKKIEQKKQTIKNKAEIRRIISECQLFISDETHIAPETIEFLSQKATNAFYKFGLTATPMRTDNADKRMFGASGKIIYKVTASDLIKKNYLVKPYIYAIDIGFSDRSGKIYAETYKNAVVNNIDRNKLISKIATKMHEKGRPTLIFVERLEHGKYLESIIPNALFVPGDDSSNSDKAIPDEELDYRRAQLNKLENNEIIMIATQWINQGVDAPKISCMILGGSCSSEIVTMQQIGRGLRLAENKNDCIIFDFKMKEKTLRNHFNSRKSVYTSEEEFVFKEIKYKENIGFYV
jgi:superfamily II DNA or RNA helicase